MMKVIRRLKKSIDMDRNICIEEGCERGTRNKDGNYCAMHIKKRLRAGLSVESENISERAKSAWRTLRSKGPQTEEEYMIAKRSWIDEEKGCWRSDLYPNGSGYICGQFKNKYFLFHRKMYEIHNGPIPEGLVVRHKCDTPGCFNPDHLEIGTKKDNRQDFMKRHPKAKEIMEEAVARAARGTKRFWDNMTQEERDEFVKRRSERQSEIRRERLANDSLSV